jgi:DNA-binding transcriptional MerR regulator
MSTKPKSKPGSKGNVDDVVIPDRLYFRIGEVAELCGLPAYVLRFWETEFSQLKPTKGNTGQRMYRRGDVETVLRIKKLLYEQGFTIAGAREHMKGEIKSARSGPPPLLFPVKPNSDELKRVRHGLQEILAMLSHPRPHR